MEREEAGYCSTIRSEKKLEHCLTVLLMRRRNGAYTYKAPSAKIRIKLRFSTFRNLRLLHIGIGIMIRITSVATLMLKKAKFMVAMLTQRPRSVTSQKALVGVHWKENTERNAMVVRVTTTSIPKQIWRINESKTHRY